MKNDTFVELVWRFLKNFLATWKATEARKSAHAYMKEILIYTIKNPAQALIEAWGVSRFKMSRFLNEIKEKGVHIALVHSERDIIFPAGDVAEFLKEVPIQSFHLVKGGHNEIHAHPEKFAKMIFDLVSRNYVYTT